MFPNTDKPLLQIPEAEEDILEGLDDDEVKSCYDMSHVVTREKTCFQGF